MPNERQIIMAAQLTRLYAAGSLPASGITRAATLGLITQDQAAEIIGQPAGG